MATATTRRSHSNIATAHSASQYSSSIQGFALSCRIGGSKRGTIHVAIKDVTNDGLPEILLAAHDGLIDLNIAVYGFSSPTARSNRLLDSTTFSLLQVLKGGQAIAYVQEGGTVVMPYGSAGLAWTCKWDDTEFRCSDYE
jgi:hypothetical protein